MNQHKIATPLPVAAATGITPSTPGSRSRPLRLHAKGLAPNRSRTPALAATRTP